MWRYIALSAQRSIDVYTATTVDACLLYTSLLPAVRKAIQSAGRHIRSPDKRGMVFLMDSRFNQPEILQMIPEWLKKDTRVGDFGPQEIETMVRDFFNQSP